MVAKTPSSRDKRMAAALNPALVRETLQKVDKCMTRLQELQYTVAGGSKVVSGVSLSPRSTRGYIRTSLRCKQETLRRKNPIPGRSPVGKFPEKPASGEWRRMSLPAMLLGETIVEILQASQFAKEVVAAASKVGNNTTKGRASGSAILADPKTPVTVRRRGSTNKATCEITELRARRTKEKQPANRSTRSESGSPRLQRARSRISFKTASPPNRREGSSGYRHVVAAQRVSPKNRPWAKKTVLFPNPIFSSPYSHQRKFCKMGSPVIQGARQSTAHKFLVKSPPTASKFQLKIKNTPAVLLSPTRLAPSRPKMAAVAKLRRSFSPSRLASRLVSPLRSRVSRREESNGRRSAV